MQDHLGGLGYANANFRSKFKYCFLGQSSEESLRESHKKREKEEKAIEKQLFFLCPSPTHLYHLLMQRKVPVSET